MSWRGRALARLRASCLAVLPAASLVACSCGSNRADAERPASGPRGLGEGGAEAPASPGRRASAAPAAIRGTAVDAASGRPLEGVLIQGPAGSQAYSDEEGRFEIRGLAAGTTGALLATTEGGLRGRNELRPLRPGTLEVVVYLR